MFTPAAIPKDIRLAGSWDYNSLEKDAQSKITKRKQRARWNIVWGR